MFKLAQMANADSSNPTSGVDLSSVEQARLPATFVRLPCALSHALTLSCFYYMWMAGSAPSDNVFTLFLSWLWMDVY